MIRSNLSVCLVNCAGQICFVHQSQYVKDDVWNVECFFFEERSGVVGLLTGFHVVPYSQICSVTEYPICHHSQLIRLCACL